MVILLANCQKKAQEQGTKASAEIDWGNNVDSALTLAAKNDKIVMIDFMATWCPPCRQMEKETFPDKRVIERAEKFIPVRIDVDKNQEIAEEYNGNAGKYGGIGIPNILFIDKTKAVKRHIVGFQDAEKLAAVMDSVLSGKYD
jgi:thiol:disulfide interchange protein